MPARDAKLLGAYILPGSAMDPLAGLQQTAEAERLGLGEVWLSELQGPFKDAGAVLGYLGHATSQVGLGTSVTHFVTRHPMILASWGATMQVLTGGRFRLGFGRSLSFFMRNLGLSMPNIGSMEDYAGILRRLWTDEKVSSDGPAGRFPEIGFGQFPEFTPPPMLLAAMGPHTLALVGRAFDGVLLHPFLTTGGLARCREIVRDAALSSGRDPDAIRIYAQVVSTPDMSDEEFGHVMLARAAAYLVNPGFMESIFEMNGWDQDPLIPFREEVARAIKENEAKGSPLQGREVLVEPARRALREEWWRTGGAVGTAADVAARLHEYVDAGADNVIVHGVTPDRLGPTVDAFVAQSA